MTKTKRAVKEVNQMADKAILKAQLDAYKAKAKEWLAVEVYGHKRAKILLAAFVIVAAVLSVS